MEGIRGRAGRLSIFAAVAALHIAACWWLLATTHPLVGPATSQRLQFLLLPPAVIPSESAASGPGRTRPSQRSLRHGAATSPAAQPNAAASGDESGAIQPPVDWVGELGRAAENSVPAEPLRQPRDFGFPRASAAPSSKSPEFGWSHARTHRVESIPGGGLLVNLNDNCVIVFIPFPFPFCAVGKKPANGDLFKHLDDPPQPGDWNAPK